LCGKPAKGSAEQGRLFWQQESYDHLVSNSQEFGHIETNIVPNPVQAGLVPSAGASECGELKPAAG